MAIPQGTYRRIPGKYLYKNKMITVVDYHNRHVFHMAEESNEISGMTVIVIGVVIFVVIVGIWYLLHK
jgi:hypothetical protein